ncbi:MAG TPA: YraN family protein [Candidatus Limnocylindrales bacterium]|nr:YraN family protein [Candidatus Limnocylindrales bacterium]
MCQPRRPTLRRRRGDAAERIAAGYLERLGWTILGRQLAVGRDELDLLAIDPGPPAVLVVIEVRSNAAAGFGPPEERVDAAKVRRIYRAAAALVAAGLLPDGRPLPRLGRRVDLVSVEDAPWLAAGVGGPRIRHLRALRPD